MGRKNNRSRQSRLQRKRNKRAAARAARPKGGGGPLEDSSWLSPRETATATCLIACGALLSSSERAPPELQQTTRAAAGVVGGVMGRIPIELDAFLHEGREWTLTCADLATVRDTFEECGSLELFERLWTLALSNEPDGAGLVDAQERDCPHRAALAFQELRACLDDPKARPTKALRAIKAEINKHTPRGSGLNDEYEGLLRAALAAWRAPGEEELQRSLAAFTAQCRKVHTRSRGQAAWWACGQLFLKELAMRLSSRAGVAGTAAWHELLTLVLAPPEAALLIARVTGHLEPLRTVHLRNGLVEWRACLERQIDVGKLSFEERIRHAIARLKLLRAQAQQDHAEDTAAEVLSAFESLQALLAHGVPPQSREIPGFLGPALLDFYVETVQDLGCDGVALRITEELMRRHREDYRLALLYATGAIALGDHSKLSLLARHAPRQHIQPDLFARCAMSWLRASRGLKAAAVTRTSLFDPLDREHRKQCLIKLSQLCLRRAATPEEYTDSLRGVLPYFPRDSFVYRDLEEKVAVEPSLVFLATMLAPKHSLKLTLTEDQSRQWVSHAREIARQYAVGSQLVISHLKTASRWFTLAAGVREAAAAQLGDFRPGATRPPVPAAPAAPPPAPPRPAAAGKKGRGRKRTEDPAPTQRGLFDAPDA